MVRPVQNAAVPPVVDQKLTAAIDKAAANVAAVAKDKRNPLLHSPSGCTALLATARSRATAKAPQGGATNSELIAGLNDTCRLEPRKTESEKEMDDAPPPPNP